MKIEWAKVIATVVVALVGAMGVAMQQTSGTVPQDQFREVNIEQCEDINELKGRLREVLLSVPPRPGREDDEFLERSLRLLEPTDCLRQVGG